ncbi:uncharacterized protein EDB91DRAFT_1114510 [Suillus paluster]|uniref:uncharacterized protein n=1 Tax=Suillus paluster TaxID=48578 RepID=UPI001B87B92D|nr:uncharacterized protein EDB91DRAFT_1114510 [Suillus paluster]KAG1747728.1 hypothetical protein EDB91DRAFT_1114510 [Suillus paluster]
MSHSRTTSNMSDLSETISEPDSVISFNENVYLSMQNADISTATYVEQARQILDQLVTKQNRWIETPPRVNNMDASKALDAVLRNARQSGGEKSERYTTCAICACPEIYEQVNLARTWFIVCHEYQCDFPLVVTAGSHQPSYLISDQATPTIDDTYGSLVSVNPERRSGAMYLNRRDGYRCVVTGMWDGEHRPASSNQAWVTLTGAHLLKRAVGVFTLERPHTAAATWNIIRHYSGMSEETIQDMERLVDDPSNGMMLQGDVHTVFDKLKVYLEQTERENEYIVKEVSSRRWIHRDVLDRTIAFQNHAAPTRDIPLPNPHFIALHAAISPILHMSGAAEVFAQILDRYDGAAGGNAGILKSNGNPVHPLSSMMSALYISTSLESTA